MLSDEPVSWAVSRPDGSEESVEDGVVSFSTEGEHRVRASVGSLGEVTYDVRVLSGEPLAEPGKVGVIMWPMRGRHEIRFADGETGVLTPPIRVFESDLETGNGAVAGWGEDCNRDWIVLGILEPDAPVAAEG